MPQVERWDEQCDATRLLDRLQPAHSLPAIHQPIRPRTRLHLSAAELALKADHRCAAWRRAVHGQDHDRQSQRPARRADGGSQQLSVAVPGLSQRTTQQQLACDAFTRQAVNLPHPDLRPRHQPCRGEQQDRATELDRDPLSLTQRGRASPQPAVTELGNDDRARVRGGFTVLGERSAGGLPQEAAALPESPGWGRTPGAIPATRVAAAHAADAAEAGRPKDQAASSAPRASRCAATADPQVSAARCPPRPTADTAGQSPRHAASPLRSLIKSAVTTTMRRGPSRITLAGNSPPAAWR